MTQSYHILSAIPVLLFLQLQHLLFHDLVYSAITSIVNVVIFDTYSSQWARGKCQKSGPYNRLYDQHAWTLQLKKPHAWTMCALLPTNCGQVHIYPYEQLLYVDLSVYVLYTPIYMYILYIHYRFMTILRFLPEYTGIYWEMSFTQSVSPSTWAAHWR